MLEGLKSEVGVDGSISGVRVEAKPCQRQRVSPQTRQPSCPRRAPPPGVDCMGLSLGFGGEALTVCTMELGCTVVVSGVCYRV